MGKKRPPVFPIPKKKKDRADRGIVEPVQVDVPLLRDRKRIARARRQSWFQIHKDEIRLLSVSMRAFLKAYTEELTIKGATVVTGVDPTFHHYAKKTNANYKRLFEDLREHVVEALEDEGLRRAYHGVAEPIYYQGELCGTKQNYSDTLLMFLLRAANPEKYRERSQMDLNVKPGDEGVDPAFRTVSREALRKIREIVEEDQLKHRLIENNEQDKIA